MHRVMVPKLICPSCGWDASVEGKHDFCFRYLEEVTSIRRVEGFNASGVLEITSDERIALDDPGANGRFQCGECLVEFAVTEGLEIDFV